MSSGTDADEASHSHSSHTLHLSTVVIVMVATLTVVPIKNTRCYTQSQLTEVTVTFITCVTFNMFKILVTQIAGVTVDML